jgi:hypothetical protein
VVTVDESKLQARIRRDLAYRQQELLLYENLGSLMSESIFGGDRGETGHLREIHVRLLPEIRSKASDLYKMNLRRLKADNASNQVETVVNIIDHELRSWADSLATLAYTRVKRVSDRLVRASSQSPDFESLSGDFKLEIGDELTSWKDDALRGFVEGEDLFGDSHPGTQLENFVVTTSDTEASASWSSRRVFIVHGHDEAAREAVARLVERAGLEAVILREQPNQGRTIIEKFEKQSETAEFAVVLLTPDDVGGARGTLPEDLRLRARQNVVAELFFFIGKLGRSKVCALVKGDIECHQTSLA